MINIEQVYSNLKRDIFGHGVDMIKMSKSYNFYNIYLKSPLHGVIHLIIGYDKITTCCNGVTVTSKSYEELANSIFNVGAFK